ncbi:MAG TPA: S-adenosyl-L-methionine-dependent methyltransferase, partial [Oribacterium sp.]|nr:S-adenosyl-L-methionine-dependent methyltransferase [Oribacterium sp.]
LLQRKDPVLKAFLKKEKQRYEEILTKTDAAEIRAAYAYCVSALEVFQ